MCPYKKALADDCWSANAQIIKTAGLLCTGKKYSTSAGTAFLSKTCPTLIVMEKKRDYFV